MAAVKNIKSAVEDNQVGVGIENVYISLDDKSIVGFNVKKRVERDSDADYSEEIVPFQIAYAVSIHKA